VGQHSVPEEPPPPKDKPRYRFLLAIAGIVALAFLAMAIVAAAFPEQSPAAAGPDDETGVANPFPTLPTVDTGGPTTVTGPASVAASRPAATRTTKASSKIGAVYSPYNIWNNGFQATVTVRNRTSTPQNWQVALVFPDSVTPTENRWVNGPSLPDVVTEGHNVVFTGTAPIAPGNELVVYFELQKSGDVTAPLVCTVNGQTCSID
jgi:hypothetical protein